MKTWPPRFCTEGDIMKISEAMKITIRRWWQESFFFQYHSVMRDLTLIHPTTCGSKCVEILWLCYKAYFLVLGCGIYLRSHHAPQHTIAGSCRRCPATAWKDKRHKILSPVRKIVKDESELELILCTISLPIMMHAKEKKNRRLLHGCIIMRSRSKHGTSHLPVNRSTTAVPPLSSSLTWRLCIAHWSLGGRRGNPRRCVIMNHRGDPLGMTFHWWLSGPCVVKEWRQTSTPAIISSLGQPVWIARCRREGYKGTMQNGHWNEKRCNSRQISCPIPHDFCFHVCHCDGKSNGGGRKQMVSTVIQWFRNPNLMYIVPSGGPSYIVPRTGNNVHQILLFPK